MLEPALSTDGSKPLPLPPPVVDADNLILLRRKLVKYAALLLAGGERSTPFGRLQAEDLASEAIVIALEILDGRKTARTWDRSRTTMLGFCRGVVRSMASNNQSSARVRSAVDCLGDVEELEIHHAPRQEVAVEFGQLFELLADRVRSHELAGAILEAVKAGDWTSPSEYAETNKLPLTAVKAAWKRILRQASQLTEIKDV